MLLMNERSSSADWREPQNDRILMIEVIQMGDDKKPSADRKEGYSNHVVQSYAVVSKPLPRFCSTLFYSFRQRSLLKGGYALYVASRVVRLNDFD